MPQRRPKLLLNRLSFTPSTRKNLQRNSRRQRLRTQLFEQLEPRIVLNSEWQNPARPLDVNNDLNTSPLDVLLIVNRLNSSGAGPLPARSNPLDFYVDTSGDGMLSPLDILRVINGLNAGVNEPDPGDGDTAPAGFIAIPLTSLSGSPGQIVRTTAEMTVGRVEFNEMGVFAADNASGSVNGVLPDGTNYAQTVFNSGRRRVLFSRLGEFQSSRQVDLPAASSLFVYVLQRSTTEAGDADQHLRVRSLDNGRLRVGWEERASVFDLQPIGDRGFDDVLVDFSFASPVDDPSPPVLNTLPVQSIPEQTELTVDVSAFDPDLPADNLTYTLDAAPNGATIDPQTGRFTWTPTEADGPGQFQVMIRVTDSFGLSDTERMFINVLEVNRPPALAPIADVQLRPGDSISIQTSASDPDLPVNRLTFALQSGAPTGSSINATSGLFRYNAPAGLPDSDLSVTVTVRDDGQPSLSASRTFTIRVRSDQRAPVVQPIPVQTIPEQTQLVVNVSSSDADLPNDTLTYSLDAAPPGAAINASTGRFTWTPTEANGPGQFEAIVRVTDRFGLFDTAVMQINVLEVNRPPVLQPIVDRSMLPGESISITSTASDPDLPANALTFSLQTGAPAGATINSTTGLISYTAPADIIDAEFPVTVVVTDNGTPALSASQSFVVRVSADRTDPVLDPIPAQTIPEQTQLVVNITAFDADANDVLTYSLDAAPTGAAINASTGRFTWTPTEANGPGQFEAIVRVTDRFGLFDTATMQINVLEVNRPPVLEPIADRSMLPGESISITSTASDPDLPANALTFSLQTGAPAGATINPSTGLISYTAPADIIDAEFPVTVVVTDNGTPTLSASQSFVIRVNADRTEPVLDPIPAQTIPEQTQLVVNITAFDADANDVLTYSLDAAPTGAAINATTGRFTWTPTEANGPGQFEAIVRVTDRFGLFDTATMQINVLEVNRPPVLEPIADRSMLPGESISITSTASDPDLPANALTFSLQTGAPTGATINPTTGLVSYTAPADIIDAEFPVTVVVTDNGTPTLSASQSFVIRVSADRTDPVLDPIPAQTIPEQTQLVVNITAFDADTNDVLTYSLDAAPTGAAINASTGRFTWTPTEANGPGQFEAVVRVTDRFGLFDTAVMQINVLEVNRPPVLEPIADRSMLPGESISITTSASDPDLPANALTFSLQAGAPAGAMINPSTGLVSYTAPADIIDAEFPVTVIVTDNGTPALSASQSFVIRVSADRTDPVLDPIPAQTIPEQTQLVVNITAFDADTNDVLTYSLDAAPTGAAIDSSTGRFTWTPTEANGPGQFEAVVRVTDRFGLFDTATMQINALEVNRPPVLEPIDDRSMLPGESISITTTASDPDLPANALTFSLQTGAPAGATINPATGLISYTAPADIIDAEFPVTVVVTDNGTPALSASQSFVIRVSADRTDPVLDPIPAQTIPEQTQLVVNITAFDADTNEVLTYSLDAAPTGAAIDSSTGRFTWTPTEANGPGQFEAIVRVTDRFGLFDTATMQINVLEVNRPPVLEPIDDVLMKPGETFSGTVTASDPDLPANGLTYSLQAGAPAGSSINPATGLISYTAPADIIDAEFPVTVIITDNGTPALSASQSFVIRVSADRTDPVLDPIPAQTIPEQTQLVVDITAFDADTNDVLTYSLDAAPTGAAIDSSTGRFTWTPTEANGPGQFEAIVRVTDRFGLFDTATMQINVLEVNRPPVLEPIADVEMFPGDTIFTTPQASDPDLPANQLSFSLGTAPAGATIDSVTGIVRYTAPPTLVALVQTITVVVNDNGAPNLSANQSFTVRIQPRRIDLVEDDRLVTQHSYPVNIPAGTQQIALDYIDLTFDQSDPSSINDAFEVALVDAVGRPAAAIISPSRDANANLTESTQPLTGVGTSISFGTLAGSGRISIDVSHLPAGFSGQLIARLVNNDNDDTTRVGLADAPLLVPGTTPSPGTTTRPAFAPTLDTLARNYNTLDWRHLADVTGGLDVDYDYTAYDTDSNRIAAGVTFTNRSQNTLRSPLLVTVDGISLPAVSVTNTAGILPADPTIFNDPLARGQAGNPFYDASTVVGEAIAPGESVRLMLEFQHTTLERFDYQLNVLAAINAAPQFTSTPLTTATPGNVYYYPSRASDPDADPLVYSLLSGPDGLTIDADSGDVHWTPAVADAGSHRVTLRTEDPYGEFDEQTFVIVVNNNGLNRPPQFVTHPVIDAYVGMPYRYDSRGSDPDADPLQYSVLVGPQGIAIEAGPSVVGNPSDTAGDVLWVPPDSAVGSYHPVQLLVQDPFGGQAIQDYRIYVHPNPINLPPVIVTEPDTSFRIPRLDAGASQGDVNPTEIEELIARGGSVTRDVTLTLPPGVNAATADVVLIVDESGSMREQAWVKELIAQLEASLEDASLTGNRYSVIGYGSNRLHPRFLTERMYDNYFVRIDVFGPQGDLLHSQRVAEGQPVLPIGVTLDGNYTVTVSGRRSGSEPLDAKPYRLHARLEPQPTVERTGWGQRTGRVKDQQELEFTANAGEMLLIDGIFGNVTRRLIDPDGVEVLPAASLMAVPTPTVLGKSGTYKLVLEAQDESYELRLVSPFDDAPVLAFDSIVSGTLSANETDLYRFSSSDELTFFLDRFYPGTGIGGLVPDQTAVRLLGKSGLITEVNMQTPGLSSPVGDLDPLALPAGEYVLLIDSSVGLHSQPIAYSMMARSLSAPLVALVDGVPANATIPTRSGAAPFEFTANAGTLFSATLTQWVGGTAQWSVLDDFGQAIASGEIGQGGQIGNVPIRQSGRYTLLIQAPQLPGSSQALQILPSFSTTNINPYTGRTLFLDQLNSGAVSATSSERYTVDLQAGDLLHLSALSVADAGAVTITMRAPSGGIVYQERASLYDSFSPYDFMYSGQFTASHSGRYQIDVQSEGSGGGVEVFGHYHLQLARVSTPLVPEQLVTSNLQAAFGVHTFQISADAGETLLLSDLVNTDPWADADTAILRADKLETTGGTEDGYWAIDYALQNLEFRPEASRQIILLTDEDRDQEHSSTRDSIEVGVLASNVGLHGLLGVHYRPSDNNTGFNNALGVRTTTNAQGAAAAQLFYPTADGGFSSLEAPGFDAQGAFNDDGWTVTVIEDYVEMIDFLGGTQWDIVELRNGNSLQRQSFTQAFVSTLTELISRPAEVGLRPVATTASGLPAIEIGTPTTNTLARQITFPVTFYGDGDAWNFDLEFFDTEQAGMAYGYVPVALAAGYRYDVLAIDPEDDLLTYTLTQGAEHGALFDPATQTLLWNPTAPGDYEFTVTASDPWGGIDEQSWIVSVAPPTVDNTPPTLAPVQDVVQEAERILAIELDAFDADGDALTYQLLPGATTGLLPPVGLTLDPATGKLLWRPARTQLGQHEITLQVVDGRGGRASQSFTIDVTPRQPNSNLRPIITSRPIQSAPVGLRYRYDVEAVDPDGDAITYSLAAAPAGMVIDRATGVVSWRPASEHIGRQSVVVRVTDEVGGATLQAFDLSVFLVNDPPQITSSPTGPAVPGVEWLYQLTAVDPNGDPVQYSLLPDLYPAGATLDSTSGLLRWTPVSTGAYRFVVQASDGRGGRVTQEFVLPVSDAAPPRIVSQPTGPARLGEPYEYLVIAYDANVAAGNDSLTWSLDETSLARGMTLSSAGCPAGDDNCSGAALLSWTPTALGDFAIAITVTDSAGYHSTQRFDLPVIRPTTNGHPPEILSSPEGPAVVAEPWSYAVLARDADPIDVLSYHLQTAPAGMTIDAATGVIEWTPTSVSDGESVELYVEDPQGNRALQVFALPVVEQLTGSEPRFRSLPTGPAVIEQVWTYTALAVDPDGTAVQYSLGTAPVGMTIDTASGRVQWRPSRLITERIEIIATDADGQFSIQRFDLPVVAGSSLNSAPEFTSTPQGPAARNLTFVYRAVAVDPDGDVVTYTLDDESIALGMTLDASDGTLRWTPQTAGDFEIAITAADPLGASTTQRFTLPVLDNAPPRIISSPTTRVELGGQWLYDVDAVDPNPGDTLVYTATGPDGLAINANSGLATWTPTTAGRFTIDVVVEDHDGARDTQTIDLLVVDPANNQPPQITGSPRSRLQFGSPFVWQVPAVDPDQDPLAFMLLVGPSGLTVDGGGLLQWTPTEAQITSGNERHEVIVEVTDGRGGSDEAIWQLSVGHSAGNGAPNITSVELRGIDYPLDDTPTGAQAAAPEQLKHAVAGRVYQALFAANDPDGDTLVWSLVDAPTGVRIDSRGLLDYRPTTDDVGSVEVQIRVTDTAGASDLFQYTLTTRGGNSPARISGNPPVHHRRGALYTTTFTAEDPDGDPVRFRFVPGSESHGASIDPVSGQLSWTPTADGTYRFFVAAADPLGEGSQLVFDVLVDQFGPNDPPVFEDTQPGVAEVGSTYSRQFPATDPDGDVLTYAVQQGPTGLTINSDNGTVTWDAPASLLGTAPDVVLTATDPAGHTARYQFRLPVRAANRAPRFDSQPELTISAGGVYRYDIWASDPDFDPLSLALASAPAGMTLDSATAQLTWTTTAADIGLHSVTLTLTDDRIATPIEQRFTITVAADTAPPQLQLLASQTAVNIDTQVSFEARAWDDVGVVERTLTVAGTAVALSAQGFGRYTFTTAGRFTAVATATDAAGNTATDELEILVRDPNNAAPSITFVSPAAGSQLSAATPVHLSVTDPEQDLTSLRLYYASSNNPAEFIEFASLIAPSGQTLGNLTDRAIGLFDPSNLVNGSYILRAVAEDAGFNQSTRDSVVQVVGRLKLGNFSASFDDLEISVGGIPITIMRAYDTLDVNTSGDFGHGWTLEVKQARTQIDQSTLGGVGSGRYRAFVDGTRVMVTTPEGTEEGFTFRAVPDQTLFGIVLSWKSNFDPDAGNNYKLEAPAGGLSQLGSEYLSGYGTTYNPQDPEFGNAFQLTSISERLKYNINATTGETSSMEDRNQNKLTLRPEGIISSRGRSVLFERDMQGRIAKITDPRGNSLLYQYDTAGNLVSFTDRMGNTTRMQYHTAPAHYLDTVTDPLGNVALKAVYSQTSMDGQPLDGVPTAPGRLSRLEDATGSFLAFQYNPTARSQSISDEDGLQAQVQFDDYGNALDHIVRGGERVIRSFDDPVKGLPRQEITVIGDVDPVPGEGDDQVMTRTYNQFGQVTSERDSRGNVTRYLYNSEGIPYSTINPDGSSTSYSFDDKYNLTSSSSSSGGTTWMTYDAAGQVTEVRSGDFSNGGGDDPRSGGGQGGDGGGGDAPRGNVTKLKYNPFGDLIETIDTEQNSRTIAYDDNGNQLGTSFTWTDPNDANNTDTLVTSNVVAPNDQTSSSTTPSGTSQVEFDPLDRPFRSIDENGLVSQSRYDSRGLTIETRTQGLDAAGAPVWLISRSVFDEDGNTLYSTDSLPEGTPAAEIYGTHNIYDSAGRVVRTERRLGVEIAIVGSPSSLSAELVSAGLLVTSSETQYDSSGRVWQTTDNYGRVSQTLFDRYGQTVETRSQAYDAAGTLVWLTSRTVHDSLGRVVLATDRYVTPADTELGSGSSPAFYATITLYDSQGRNSGSQRVEGASVTISGSATNLESSVATRGTLLYESKTIYDSRSRVARSISPIGEVTDYIYDSRDRQIATVGTPQAAELIGLGSQYPGKQVRLRSETEFDAYGQVALQSTGIVQVEEPDGTLITIDRSDVREIRSQYDSQGRLLSTIHPDGTSVSSEYDQQGRVIAETNQLGLRRLFEYDSIGRLIAVVLPEVIDPATGNSVQPRYEYGYDEQGNQTLLRDPLGRETRFEFDSSGRQLSRTLPLGFGADGIEGTADDAAVTDGDWTEHFTYDSQGRMETHVSFEGVVARYVYDDTAIGGGRLLSQQFYPNRAAHEAAPDSPSETWTFAYDEHGRQVSVVMEGDQPRRASWHYDQLGRLVFSNTPEGAIEYQYDIHSRRVAARIGDTLAAGQSISSFTPQRSTQYTYDRLSRLATVREEVSVSGGASPSEHRYFYDLLGSLDAELSSGGLYKDYVYDNMQRLRSQKNYITDGTVADLTDLSDDPLLVRFDYNVREDGRRTGADEFWYTVGSATQATPLQASYEFSYDNLGRLTDEVFDHWDDTLDYRDRFVYDPVGNRVEKSRDNLNNGNVDASTTYQFDANDRLLDELTRDATGQSKSQTTYTYHYTQNTGQSGIGFQPVAPQTLPTINQTYTYDLQGRLHTATVTHYDSAGQAATITRSTYDYDHTGIRVSALNETDTNADGTYETRTKIEYLVDHHNHTGYQQVIRESHYNAATGLLQKTVDLTYGHDELHQTTTDYDTAGNITATVRHYFLHDGKASVRALLDATAAIIQLYHYTAYGQLHALHTATAQQLDAAAALTNLLYNGEQFDPLTQQQYLRARYYNPANAQFNRLDPFFGNAEDPQSFNKYAFVHGDPIQGVDPTGNMVGYVSTTFSTMTSMSSRGSSLGAAMSALRVVRQSAHLYEFLQILITIAAAGSAARAGNYAAAVRALTGIDPNEVLEIKNELDSKGLRSLNKHAIGSLPMLDFDFNLPGDPNRPAKMSPRQGRIGRALRLVTKVIGSTNFGQEVLGELGTYLVASILGFASPGLSRAHWRWGPDFILRHTQYPDAWAIIEAKGGTSTLGTSKLVRPRQPTRAALGMRPIPGEGPAYPQMGARWIEFWLRHTVQVNRSSTTGQALNQAFIASDPMLAAVVSLNLNRPKELRIGIQPFVPPRGISFNAWKGF